MTTKEKATELMNKIKQLFAQTLPTAYKLADGTDVTISLLDVGGDFSVGGVPATEGTYTLQDGTNVTVDATGKITSVDEPSEFAAGTEYTLQDGTKVTIDKMAVGGKVMQGEQPIANGDYTLQDGSKISVADGLITVVTPAAAAAAKMSKEDVQQAYDTISGAAPDAQMAGVITCIKALMDYCFGWQIDNAGSAQEAAADAQQVADAITAVSTMRSQYKAKFTKQENEIANLKTTLNAALELMTQLAEAPSGDPPPNERKVVFSGEKPNSKRTALERYAAAAQTLHEQNSEVTA